MLKWWSSNLFIHIPTNSPRPPIHTHRHTEYLQTNSRLRKRRESLQKMQELSSSLPLLCFTKRLKRIPCDPGACGEAGRGRPLGLACRGWAGPACVQKLPQSDFPTADLQPSPCPCLKNFLNSIPVLFRTALKPYSACTSIRLCQANSHLLGRLQLSMGNTCVKHRLAPLPQRPWGLLGSHNHKGNGF